MGAKYILIKIYSKDFYNLLEEEILNYEHINFFSKKINGTYTVVVKCQNYYNQILDYYDSEKIYLSYIYLYTSISLILSELIIKFYEQKITNQIFKSKYNYLSSYEMSKMINIASSVLDVNFPSASSKRMYLYRKDLILNKLLLNFRKRNYIHADHFVYFKLEDYHEHLEDIIQKTYSHY